MALMGLDVGSTGCKAVVFDAAGNQLSRAYREYPEIYPQAGWIELDPERVWQSVREVIAEAAGQTGEPVRAISISAMGETFTPVAEDGRFLYNSIVSPDSRAVPQAQALADALGPERIFAITGMPAHPSFTLPKIMWFAQERPRTPRAGLEIPAVAGPDLLQAGPDPAPGFFARRPHHGLRCGKEAVVGGDAGGAECAGDPTGRRRIRPWAG